MAAMLSISSGVYGKAFLAKAWEDRHKLLDYERRGFTQFFYLTICGHIEEVIADILKQRIHFINIAIDWEQLPPMNYRDGDITHTCPIEPVVKSIKNLASTLISEVNSAPYAKLSELYVKLFGASIGKIIGNDLEQDIKALTTLRNIFAHGRNLYMKFEVDESWAHIGTLDGNILKQPSQRLYDVGIIKNLNITGQNYHDFQALFYSDEVMLHFYNAASQAEKHLTEATTFLPERKWPGPQPLPDLNP
ncbi:MAG: hypothetical protein ACR65R_14440 [Methylomicrobium sp.]